jgi:hypothetical protein
MLALLKEPLFPYNAYVKFTHDHGQNGDLEYIKSVIEMLPKPNYVTLMFVLRFFIEAVISHSSQNKMNHYNIAAVLLPSLMRSSTISIEDLIYTKKLVLVL